MEATIQSDQMDVDKEEAIPNSDLACFPQARHVLRMQEFPLHSPLSVPTNFHVNSEPELIEGNILRAETFSSGRNGNISVPIQKLAQRSKRRGVGNMPKPLAGGQELLLTYKRLSGSDEAHRTLRRV
ncbi:hypothetical protein O181_079889, partial [Austropuccinia psidii MF-1]|nr:hypothetical protein [Austropuccinia psidii MF-1]